MESTETLLEKFGLNWTVRSEKLVTESGIEIPKMIGIVREDNNSILGVHGEGYTPYQNHELFDLVQRISERTDMKVPNGGLFGEGRKVWFQMKSEDLIIGSDKVEGYITGINSFDGSTNLGFGTSNITISCLNTFYKSYRDVESRLRHSKNLIQRIDMVMFQMETLRNEEQNTFKTIKRLNEVEITPLIKELVVKRLFDLSNEDNLGDMKDLSTRKKNQIDKFYVDLETELQGKGRNLWGLFSGVTRYTTHSIKDDNSEQKMTGLIGNRERSIWNELEKVVSD